ncbi:MAG TPA: hypothetical protein VEX13_00220 [Chloroflexia bacterium]|nr:hypothetical protein [Chloroflexia bacterium]
MEVPPESRVQRHGSLELLAPRPQTLPVSVTGRFANAEEAERAVERLHTLGIAPAAIYVEGGEKTEAAKPDALGSNVGGGAAAGAALGALLGATLGWMVNTGAVAIPGAGVVTGVGLLASTAGGVLIGAALGGLIGALIGFATPVEDEVETAGDAGVEVSVQSVAANAGQVESLLRSSGAYDVHTHGPSHHSQESVAPAESAAGDADIHEHEESTGMSNDETRGQDPNSVTGTKGAFDPETGAYGTAGTPLTTGYGVSGSTAGTGSPGGRETYEGEEYVGSTPDMGSYEGGGRGSTDSADPAIRQPSEPPVEDKYADKRVDEAPVQSEPEHKDVYEQGPSYGADAPANPDLDPDTDATQHYSEVSVDTPPTYAKVEMDASNESAGTDIPGTADVRGLGDNTDDPRDER